MTPLEWLIAILIGWWMLRTLLVEGALAVRGVVPPTWQRGSARAARAGRRYGARDYLGDLYSDAWRSARSRREARLAARGADGPTGDTPRRSEPATGRSDGPGWRERLAARWGQAWDRMSARWQARQARRGAPPGPEPVAPAGERRERGAGGDGDQGAGSDQSRPGDQTGQSAGQDPAGGPVRVDHDPDTSGDQTDRAGERRPVQLSARPANGGRWEVVDDPDHTGRGQETNERNGDRDMSEVTGLTSAIGYAGGMRQAHEQSVAAAESWAASLSAGGVTGPAVEAAHRAAEAQQQAAAAWAEAQAALERHVSVKEQYEANPDAGSREFVTSE